MPPPSSTAWKGARTQILWLGHNALASLGGLAACRALVTLDLSGNPSLLGPSDPAQGPGRWGGGGTLPRRAPGAVCWGAPPNLLFHGRPPHPTG